MSDEWDKYLRPHFSYVVQQLQLDEVLDGLRQQEGMLSLDEYTTLNRTRSLKSDEVCSRILLSEILPKKGPDSFRKFCNVLRSIPSQKHIVEKLLSSQSGEIVQEADQSSDRVKPQPSSRKREAVDQSSDSVKPQPSKKKIKAADQSSDRPQPSSKKRRIVDHNSSDRVKPKPSSRKRKTANQSPDRRESQPSSKRKRAADQTESSDSVKPQASSKKREGAKQTSQRKESQPPKRKRNKGRGDKDSTDFEDSATRDSLPMSHLDNIYCLNENGKPGKVLVINNMEFDKKEHDRHGAQHDNKIEDVFRDLGFEVEAKENLSAAEILKTFERESCTWKMEYGCFVAVVMTHGNEKGSLLGRDDKEVNLEKILRCFSSKRCPALSGKPKVFFVQACRGDEIQQDRIGNLSIDDVIVPDIAKSIPAAADFFVGFATGQGFAALRIPTYGTLYIQQLVNTLSQSEGKTELCEMHTLVNALVGTNLGNQCGYRQAPQFVSSLTKRLYLSQHTPSQ